jgi:8-oxo-dGTP diphosphatase
MKKYVIGFAFSKDLKQVVLIRKNRPEYLAGKLNGVGGKIEKDEAPVDAMTREFMEETGVGIDIQERWICFAFFTNNRSYEMTCFMTSGDFIKGCTTTTDENIARYDVDDLIRDHFEPNSVAIFNLPWLLLMARQMLLGRDSAPHYRIEHQ